MKKERKLGFAEGSSEVCDIMEDLPDLLESRPVLLAGAAEPGDPFSSQEFFIVNGEVYFSLETFVQAGMLPPLRVGLEIFLTSEHVPTIIDQGGRKFFHLKCAAYCMVADTRLEPDIRPEIDRRTLALVDIMLDLEKFIASIRNDAYGDDPRVWPVHIQIPGKIHPRLEKKAMLKQDGSANIIVAGETAHHVSRNAFKAWTDIQERPLWYEEFADNLTNPENGTLDGWNTHRMFWAGRAARELAELGLVIQSPPGRLCLPQHKDAPFVRSSKASPVGQSLKPTPNDSSNVSPTAPSTS